MKSRSIAGFVTGLIGIIIGVPIGFVAFIALALILAIAGSTMLSYSVYLFALGLIFAIIGVCFYFTQAKIGAIFMFIAAFLYVIPVALGLYVVLTTQNPESLQAYIFTAITWILPAIMMFVSGICGAVAKRLN